MKIYLDTSVYGGHYDKGMESSVQLINWINANKNVKVCYSKVIRDELRGAPKNILHVFQKINNKKYVKLSTKSKRLSNLYIRLGVLPPHSYDDAQHVAVASVNKVDYILSWNMKHMVRRVDLFSNANKLLNLNPINILTPKKFLEYHGKKSK